MSVSGFNFYAGLVYLHNTLLSGASYYFCDRWMKINMMKHYVKRIPSHWT